MRSEAQDHKRTAVSYFQANSDSHVALQIDAVRYKSTHVLELIDREQACEESRTVDRLLEKSKATFAGRLSRRPNRQPAQCV
jgi:hypothetical protein